MKTVTSFKHNLGVKAIDPISGFEGIIVSRVHYLYGCSQYGLATKKNSDGTIPNTEYFDESRIVIDSELGSIAKEIPVNDFDEIFAIPFGKKGRDKVTGLTGIITYGIEYLYGSTQYGLNPEIDKDGKIPDAHQFDEGRIEVLDQGGIDPKDVQAPKRGGINRDAPRSR